MSVLRIASLTSSRRGTFPGSAKTLTTSRPGELDRLGEALPELPVDRDDHVVPGTDEGEGDGLDPSGP